MFWSKNYRPFMKKLTKLELKGFKWFIFNFTITGLPKIFEPNIPPEEETIADFIELSRRYGKKALLWRFDPILFSDITDENYYIERFGELADRLALYTERCIFSFAFFYNKVKRALGKLEEDTGIRAYDVEVSRKRELAEKLGEIAVSYGLSFEACCCGYLEGISGVSPCGALQSYQISFRVSSFGPVV